MILGVAAYASAVEVSLPESGKTWADYTWTLNGTDYSGTVQNYTLNLQKGSSGNALVSPDKYSIRIYAGAQLTVTAPEGVTFDKVTVTINATGNKATSATAEGWTVSEFTDGVFTMTASAPQTSVTFDGNGKQLRVASMVINASGEGTNPTPGPDPQPQPEGDKYNKISSNDQLVDGSYVMVVGEQFGAAISATDSFGRLNLTDATFDGDAVVVEAVNAIEIKKEAAGYTMVDSYGRYLGMDATHLTSFQLYTEAGEGCYWTIDVTAEGAKINSTLNPTCLVGVTKGNQGTWYTNIAPANEPTEYQLPALYLKEKSDAINDVNVDNSEAPVEYFNLQGMRINEPAAGQIVIRRQGNQVSKIFVK